MVAHPADQLSSLPSKAPTCFLFRCCIITVVLPRHVNLFLQKLHVTTFFALQSAVYFNYCDQFAPSIPAHARFICSLDAEGKHPAALTAALRGTPAGERGWNGEGASRQQLLLQDKSRNNTCFHVRVSKSRQ